MPFATIHQITLSVLFLPFILLTAVSAYAEPLPNRTVQVDPGASAIDIPWRDLDFRIDQHAGISISKPPTHGWLFNTGNRSFSYIPSGDFWTVGTDSFSFDLAPLSNREQKSVGLVTLISNRHGESSQLSESFEETSLDVTVYDPLGHLSLSPEAAVSGDMGVAIEELPVGGSAYVTFDSIWPIHGGNQGSQIRMGIDPPGSGVGLAEGSGAGPTTGGENLAEAIILAGYVPSGDVLFQVRMRISSDGSLALRAEVPSAGGGVAESTPWQAMDPYAQELVVDWWESFDPNHDAGLAFWVDDVFVGDLGWDLTFNLGQLIRYDFGIVESFGPTPMGLRFDDLQIDVGYSRPQYTVITADTFEDVAIQGWNLDNSNELAVTLGSALSGNRGLVRHFGPWRSPDSMVVDSAQGIVGSTSDKRSFRFQVDPNSLIMEPDEVLIFGATSDDSYASGAGGEHLRLWLRASSSGGYELRAEALSDGGFWTASDWIALSDQPYTVELLWQGASNVLSYDGYLRLWLDSTWVASLEGLNNHELGIGASRLGGSEVDVAITAGELFFDNYESWGTAW